MSSLRKASVIRTTVSCVLGARTFRLQQARVLRAYEPVEWAKVVFAAKAHGDASSSSPTLRFYQPGTALRVVGRQNRWVQITDPTSGERGWVFERSHHYTNRKGYYPHSAGG